MLWANNWFDNNETVTPAVVIIIYRRSSENVASTIKTESFINFRLQNNLRIRVIFMDFVNIWTSADA